MEIVRQDSGMIKVDWESDRREVLEGIRRQAWNRAEIAVLHIEGVAAALSASGLDQSARSLLAACGNINAVLRQYA